MKKVSNYKKMLARIGCSPWPKNSVCPTIYSEQEKKWMSSCFSLRAFAKIGLVYMVLSTDIEYRFYTLIKKSTAMRFASPVFKEINIV